MTRLPEVVNGTPAQVARRLVERLFVVGDVWFPTRKEMVEWEKSTAPLYVKWTRSGGFEIGPRLETVPAARIAPVFRGRLSDGGGGTTRIAARMSFPRLTWAVLVIFLVAGVVWGVQIGMDLAADRTHAGWAVVCALYLIGVVGGASAAWWWGRRALLAEVPWLTSVLGRSAAEGEDW